MASIPPRPKPWESSSPVAGPSKSAASQPSAFDTAIQTSTSNSVSNAPALPEKPTGLGSSAAYGGYSSSMQPYSQRYNGSYGMSPYNNMSGYGSYGGYGAMGGMNRFGGGYGGYNYGMGGYGVGGMGGPGEGYPTLASSLQASTAPAFAVVESLVTAFTSLAQLVESTYLATHSSFFAMVGVADQLGSLKTYLGQVLGVFSILRLGRKILSWLKGKKVKTGPWGEEWDRIGSSGLPPNGQGGRPSIKPLVIFLLSALGLPYLMSRLVKVLVAHQTNQKSILSPDGTIDPTKLEFVRAKWEFTPTEEWELGLGRDEIVAVLEKRGEGMNSWWRGRTRDGRTGWFPANYVEVIRRDTRSATDKR
ncbi:peroxisomal membrane protein pex13 (peroxin-13), putative [Cryptococcus deneoformans JEC21]|uniref:Peroxisomal membrane protein PEX13 n=1 Tax=Cryptococcus deneoformans (strain JEC21 / ATCC MYA-565) TaxID=214684 RepID=Q5KKC0_CRYD1|nr:peroxisomal membrane protein pex13 (peroxin-13), putative [Cryptococcus neoformans var. neoformans JEC21]AAW42381.2 peroxisomal membrane protein pex13 (peroxin-13), putative [Cryptococcus neoformans var. neoformans JEC21]